MKVDDPETCDIYAGLDRFGRIKDCRWRNTETEDDLSRIQYGRGGVVERIKSGPCSCRASSMSMRMEDGVEIETVGFQSSSSHPKCCRRFNQPRCASTLTVSDRPGDSEIQSANSSSRDYFQSGVES